MVSNSAYVDVAIAIVIPTLNRPLELQKILMDIEMQSLKPKKTIIVDSSPITTLVYSGSLNVDVVATPIKSAAVQRNIGIERIMSSKNKYDYVAFLDDDVRINSDYFEKLVHFIREKNAIGVSGVARPLHKERQFFNPLLRIIGFNGEEGSVTKAAINLPVRNPQTPMKTQWLIGCSLWKYGVMSSVRFERDFTGSSIFEDVLFSLRAGKIGKLWVNPCITIHHRQAQENRLSDFGFYREWCHNRYRLRDVAPNLFSLPAFLFVNLLTALRLLLVGRLGGARGVLRGHMDIYKR